MNEEVFLLLTMNCLSPSRGIRRKRQFEMHVDSPLSEINYPIQGSSGLTQEIDTLDLGSSTPKKRRAKSPLKGVLKVK